MGLGLSSYDWQNYTQDFVNQKTYMYRSANQNYATNTTNLAQTSSQTTSNTCTDGSDDGKIGALDTIFHIGKGAIDGLINGVKGMFTNDKGEFDPLKTLGTVALGAACVAFPAVGLVACGIGAVSGGVKLATGVSNALNAKTDAEAKDAWEQVGDGALTTGLSVAGAKASLNAVKSTSTAAEGLSSLADDATKLEKAAALGKDMISSTKNQAGKIKTYKNAIDVKNAMNAVDEAKSNGVVGDDAVKALETLDKFEDNADVMKLAGEMREKQVITDTSKQGLLSKTKLPEFQLKNIANNVRNFKENASFDSLRSTLSDTAQAVVDFLRTEKGTYAEAVQKFGYNNVAEALEVFAGYRMLDETV